jgi:hypothetical protein
MGDQMGVRARGEHGAEASRPMTRAELIASNANGLQDEIDGLRERLHDVREELRRVEGERDAAQAELFRIAQRG